MIITPAVRMAMAKITCEWCGRRVSRGSHFVCQGKPVQGWPA